MKNVVLIDFLFLFFHFNSFWIKLLIAQSNFLSLLGPENLLWDISSLGWIYNPRYRKFAVFDMAVPHINFFRSAWRLYVALVDELVRNYLSCTYYFQDIEYIRSHYNIEDFIYYNHHRRLDHGHLHHYALNPMFTHLSKHFLKVKKTNIEFQGPIVQN